MEPHDLAALLTCVVSVDPRPPAAQRLMRELHAWEEARLRAEEDYEDPDVIAFDPRVDDVEFAFDESLPGLARFLEAVKIAKRDNRFGRILVCLMWARGIQKMIPNLYNPKGRK
ncbi:hypothetical protein EPN81_00150 [Patescibacteria group bacterium]|nr:MAG: hypothetical protein EPN81_00150 [Patescibacteria group bacterium]